MGREEISRVVPCKDCAFSVFIPHDVFTGKPRYHCGKGHMIVDEFGDATLMCDYVGGGCEFGQYKPLDDP